MHSNLIPRILFFSLCLAGLFACSRQSPSVKAEGYGITVRYGQPSKNGRVIFGELVPYGKVWRTGANEATEITFSKNVTFGGQPVSAGTYTLFTIPETDKWTVILNSVTGQWGAYNYDKHKDKNVLTTQIEPRTLESVVEKLTFEIDSQGIGMAWDNVKIFIPVE